MHFSNDNFAGVGHTLGLLFAQSLLGLTKEAAGNPMFGADNEARFRAQMNRPIDPGPRQVATRRISAFGSEADSALAAQQGQRAGGTAPSARPARPRQAQASRVSNPPLNFADNEGSTITARRPVPKPNNPALNFADSEGSTITARRPAPRPNNPPLNFATNEGSTITARRPAPKPNNPPLNFADNEGSTITARRPATTQAPQMPRGMGAASAQSKPPGMAPRSPAPSMPSNMSQFFGGGNKPAKPATTSQAPNMGSNPTKSYIRG